MNFEVFKEIHADKTPLEKLDLLADQFDNYRRDAVSCKDASWRRNTKEETYWRNECEAMKERCAWLMEDLRKALASNEPVPPKWEKRRHFTAPYCAHCGTSLSESLKPDYCHRCGKAVKWDG